MRTPRFGLATRLILLTIGLVITGQLINAGILAAAEKTLRMQRAEAVLAERITAAVRLAEFGPRVGERLARRPGFALQDSAPSDGDPVARAEALLALTLEENGVGERGLTVRLLERGERQVLVAGVELRNGRWLSYRQPLPRNARVPWGTIILQSLVLVVILTIPAVWTGRAVATPLRTLTAAADGFLTGKEAPALPRGGPPDIRALCEAFAALEQRILGALEEKSVMLGSIGHDLRTPLASLRIRVESVEDPELREDMIASIDELAATLDDILTFSRSTSKGSFDEVRSDALLARLEASYGSDRLRLLPGGSASLRCAPESVLRALRNLVDNAIRYGEQAELSVSTSDDVVLFTVTDRGPGLSEEDIDRLQRPFERAEPSRSRARGGAGLGLAIARAVAEAHKGRLELKNRQGGGLAATLALPR